MKKKLSIIVMLFMLMVLSSCSGNSEQDEYTVLIYMCGSNLESRGGCASANLEEAIQAQIPDNVNVVIETGGSKHWKNNSISSEKLGRYVVNDGKLEKVEDVASASMGNPKTLSSFITWATTEYPADKTSLVLWDHGGGSTKGLCFDELYKYDGLTLKELDSALHEAKAKFDFIGMDACLMASYDTAKTVADYADYLIASEDLEPSSGWDYKVLLEKVGTKNFYKKFLESYIKKNHATEYITLSAINLEKMSVIENIYNDLLQGALRNKEKFGRSIEKGTSFGENDILSGYSDIYDMGELAKNMGGNQDYASAVMCVKGKSRSS